MAQGVSFNSQNDLEYLPLGAAEIAPDGEWLTCSPTLSFALGYPAPEPPASSFFSVFDLLDPAREAEQRRALLDGRISFYGCEATAKREDGQTLPVRLVFSAVDSIAKHDPGSNMLVLVEDLRPEREAGEALRNSEQARHEMARRLTHAQESERTRIARELHDDIGQSLAILRIQFLRAGQPVSGMPGKRHTSVAELCNDLRDLAGKVSRLSHQLHSSELEYLGLSAAVQSHCREFGEKYKIAVTCSCGDIPKDLDGLTALSLLRVVQEALHNAVKHSRAKEITVALQREGDEITLDICDDGVGFDLEEARLAAGLGLISMRERIHLAGGSFEITSRPGEGTRVRAWVPINQP